MATMRAWPRALLPAFLAIPSTTSACSTSEGSLGAGDSAPIAVDAASPVARTVGVDANLGSSDDAALVGDTAKTGCSDPLTFADPDVENAVRQAIGLLSGPIHPADVANFASLNLLLPNSPAYGATPTDIDYADPPRLDNLVTSLAGVECIQSLRDLALNPYLVDLTPLGRLPNLSLLSFSQTFESSFPATPHVTNLSAWVFSNATALLSACPSLRTLSLQHADLSSTEARAALSALRGLTTLSLSSAGLTDTAPLLPLTRLTDVDLDSNQIQDISSLSALPNLRSLDLSGNSITDLTPLVANVGIGYGTAISIVSNPIDCAAQQQNISTLRTRGVTVVTGCP